MSIKIFNIAALLCIVGLAQAWAPSVCVKPIYDNNAGLTTEELSKLYHLDEAVTMIRQDAKAKHLPYTSVDRALLWRTNSFPQMRRNELSEAEAYTPTERSELFRLHDTTLQSHQGTHQAYTPQDLQELWKLQEQTEQVKQSNKAVHHRLTDQDRVELWHLDKVDNRKELPRFVLLEDKDRAEMWHLNQHELVGSSSEHLPYTDKDLELLMHLEETEKMLHDETKRHIYSNDDRSELWHLQKDAGMEPNGDGSYSFDERAEMWHLEEHKDQGRDYENGEYTAQDRKQLWHL